MHTCYSLDSQVRTSQYKLVIFSNEENDLTNQAVCRCFYASVDLIGWGVRMLLLIPVHTKLILCEILMVGFMQKVCANGWNNYSCTNACLVIDAIHRHFHCFPELIHIQLSEGSEKREIHLLY